MSFAVVRSLILFLYWNRCRYTVWNAGDWHWNLHQHPLPLRPPPPTRSLNCRALYLLERHPYMCNYAYRFYCHSDGTFFPLYSRLSAHVILTLAKWLTIKTAINFMDAYKCYMDTRLSVYTIYIHPTQSKNKADMHKPCSRANMARSKADTWSGSKTILHIRQVEYVPVVEAEFEWSEKDIISNKHITITRHSASIDSWR